ncbi:unnamed protein product [Effrenium voratum]|nr:unnamed protein product [Effrenium voratum]
MGRVYRLCVDVSGPGGYNGLQLGDSTEIVQVYVAGIRAVLYDGLVPGNYSTLQVLCEPTGDLYQLGCQTYALNNSLYNPGATSAYLAVTCDSADYGGFRVGDFPNETASAYLAGGGDPYFYFEWDTRDMQLGVHYRLCEDLDGADSVAAFNWPGIVVYVGGVTSIATVLRDPKDGPVVTAASGQRLLLNCLYGACSAAAEAQLGEELRHGMVQEDFWTNYELTKREHRELTCVLASGS